MRNLISEETVVNYKEAILSNKISMRKISEECVRDCPFAAQYIASLLHYIEEEFPKEQYPELEGVKDRILFLGLDLLTMVDIELNKKEGQLN